MSIGLSTLDIPKDPAVRRAWVVFQLRLRGKSLLGLARESGVSAQAMSQALLVPSSHCEKVIADALGLKVRTLFPERFGPDGGRLFKTREPQRSTARHGRNGKAGEAA